MQKFFRLLLLNRIFLGTHMKEYEEFFRHFSFAQFIGGVLPKPAHSKIPSLRKKYVPKLYVFDSILSTIFSVKQVIH